MSEDITIYPNEGDQKLIATFKPMASFTYLIERLAEHVELLDEQSARKTLSSADLPDWCQQILHSARSEYEWNFKSKIVEQSVPNNR